jgi:hypothetical protein
VLPSKHGALSSLEPCFARPLADARLLRAVAAGFPMQIELTAAERGHIVNALLPPTDLRGEWGLAAQGTYSLCSAGGERASVWASLTKHSCMSVADHPLPPSVLHTTTDHWAVSNEVLFLHGDGNRDGDLADLVSLLSSAGCEVTDAPKRAFEGLERAAASSGVKPQAFTPAAVRDWMTGSGRGQLQAWLNSLDDAARCVACRQLLAYVVSDLDKVGRPAAVQVMSIPLVCLVDGSCGSITDRTANGKLLLDLESDTSGTLVASCGLELMQIPSRFVEDADGDDNSCARILWPHRERLGIDAFSPADAVVAKVSIPTVNRDP